MERINGFHNFVLIITILIALFVTLLLGYVMVRFRASANPVPSKTTHNPLLEVLWTVIPVLILAVIAVPSFRLLYFQDAVPDPEMTLRVTGSQWFWTYEYPDNGNFVFDAVMLQDDELADGQFRLLETDNRVVLPVDTNIRIEITADDVLHSWAVPAFGIKTDAVPGRNNTTWTRIEKEGVYYGQCTELCGINHGFMPIVVEAVSKEQFEAWVVETRAKFAHNALPASRKIAAHGGAPREDAERSGLSRVDGLAREDSMALRHAE
ncbi:MAG: cytochrome c oxidase subunit II [Proteobacteria bacterium]|nr:cytochrome c oxidase subunit II [Pseudomonadota bacterium]